MYMYVYDPEAELEPEPEPEAEPELSSDKMSEPEPSSNFPVPQPLFWDSWPPLSFSSTGPASPGPAGSSQEPSDMSGLDQGDPLGLLQDVLWALSSNQ